MVDSRRRGVSGLRPQLDWALVLFLTVFAAGVVLLGDGWFQPLRVALVGALLLFLPGYALLLAVCPTTVLGLGGQSWRQWSPGVATGQGVTFDTTAGTVIAVGASVALSVFTGLVLNWSPWGITPASVTLTLAGVTVALVGLAWRRTSGSVSGLEPSLRALVEGTTDTTATPRLVVSVLFGVCLVGGLLGVTMATPTGGESLTELGVVTGTGDYPLAVDDAGTVEVTLTNHEGRTVEYVLRSTVRWRPADRVTNATTHERWRQPLQDGETRRFRYTVRPPAGAANGTAVFRLYRDDTSGDPTAGDAYRTVSVGLTVTGGTNASAGAGGL